MTTSVKMKSSTMPQSCHVPNAPGRCWNIPHWLFRRSWQSAAKYAAIMHTMANCSGLHGCSAGFSLCGIAGFRYTARSYRYRAKERAPPARREEAS
jgi:hypothetical protein